MIKQKHSRLPKEVAHLFRILGQPARIKILLAIGAGEACVCHLEAVTGWRQAYISQHLMALRGDGLVDSRRDGRNIYYHLLNVGVLDLIREAGYIAGVSDVETAQSQLTEPLANCACPHCNALLTLSHQGEGLTLAIGISHAPN